MKTEFEARPVYLTREDRIRSHFLICYLALLILRIIEQRLRKDGFHYTAGEIIDSLRNYDAIDMGSFYVGAMDGKATSALESTFGIKLSYQGL